MNDKLDSMFNEMNVIYESVFKKADNIVIINSKGIICRNSRPRFWALVKENKGSTN
jgi:hypothetical protein